MILKKNGVHLISVMEPIAEGSQGILVETLLEGMAEYYSAELSEKVIRGQTENALKGKCTGGTGTIGYKIDEDKFYHLDPLTAPLVLEAFQRYDNGDGSVLLCHCPQGRHPAPSNSCAKPSNSLPAVLMIAFQEASAFAPANRD